MSTPKCTGRHVRQLTVTIPEALPFISTQHFRILETSIGVSYSPSARPGGSCKQRSRYVTFGSDKGVPVVGSFERSGLRRRVALMGTAGLSLAAASLIALAPQASAGSL